MNYNMGGGGPVTAPGVLADFKRVKDSIGKKLKETPGIIHTFLKDDPQFPRTMINNSKWGMALKRQMEKRDTKRPQPGRDKGVSQSKVIDDKYTNSEAITVSNHKMHYTEASGSSL